MSQADCIEWRFRGIHFSHDRHWKPVSSGTTTKYVDSREKTDFPFYLKTQLINCTMYWTPKIEEILPIDCKQEVFWSTDQETMYYNRQTGIDFIIIYSFERQEKRRGRQSFYKMSGSCFFSTLLVSHSLPSPSPLSLPSPLLSPKSTVWLRHLTVVSFPVVRLFPTFLNQEEGRGNSPHFFPPVICSIPFPLCSLPWLFTATSWVQPVTFEILRLAFLFLSYDSCLFSF